MRMIGVRLEMQRRNPLGMAVGLGRTGVDQKAVAVFHQSTPHETELRLLAMGPRIRIAGRGVRLVLVEESRLPVPADRIGRSVVVIIRLEAFHRPEASNSVSSTEKGGAMLSSRFSRFSEKNVE